MPNRIAKDVDQHFFRCLREAAGVPKRGLLRLRVASINDSPIRENERKFNWQLGRRPDDHKSLSELDL
jgi:uncharacterized protein